MSDQEFKHEFEGQALHRFYNDGASRIGLQAAWWRFCKVILPGKTTLPTLARPFTSISPPDVAFIVHIMLRFKGPVSKEEVSFAGHSCRLTSLACACLDCSCSCSQFRHACSSDMPTCMCVCAGFVGFVSLSLSLDDAPERHRRFHTSTASCNSPTATNVDRIQVDRAG
jgi:hypothetical protein